VAFEFIETKEEVIDLFGQTDDENRNSRIKNMDLGNRLDFIYMFLYSLFLFCFSWKCAGLSRKRIFLLGTIISVAILLGDFFENIQLLYITSKFETETLTGQLYNLKMFTWIKWGGLAIIFLVLSPYFIAGSRYSKIVGVFGWLPMGLGILAWFYRSVINELFAISVGIMFVLMIIYCFIHRRNLQANHQ
jgi:hypothetical protein